MSIFFSLTLADPAIKDFCVCEGDACVSICQDYQIIADSQLEAEITALPINTHVRLHINGSDVKTPQCPYTIFNPKHITIMAISDRHEQIQIDLPFNSYSCLNRTLIELENVDMLLHAKNMPPVWNAQLAEAGAPKHSSSMAISEDEEDPDVHVLITVYFQTLHLDNAAVLPGSNVILTLDVDCIYANIDDYAREQPYAAAIRNLQLTTNTTTVVFNGDLIILDEANFSFRSKSGESMKAGLHTTSASLTLIQKMSCFVEATIFIDIPTDVTFAQCVYEIPFITFNVSAKSHFRSMDGIVSVPEVNFLTNDDMVIYEPPYPTPSKICLVAEPHYSCPKGTSIKYIKEGKDISDYVSSPFTNSVEIYIASGNPYLKISKDTIPILGNQHHLKIIGTNKDHRSDVRLSFAPNPTDFWMTFQNINIDCGDSQIFDCEYLTMENVVQSIPQIIVAETITSDEVSLHGIIKCRDADLNAVSNISLTSDFVGIGGKSAIISTYLDIHNHETTLVNINVNGTSFPRTGVYFGEAPTTVNINCTEYVPDYAALRLRIQYQGKLTVNTNLPKLPAFDFRGDSNPVVNVVPEKHSDHNTAIIVGCSVGGVVLVAVAAVIVFIVIRKRKGSKAEFNSFQTVEENKV